jgi:excisionase family DNA binding protein
MEALLTINEVSELTQLSVGTLYHWISQQRIPVVHISSRCVRFRQADIEQWLAEKVVPSQDPLCSPTGKRGRKKAGNNTAEEENAHEGPKPNIRNNRGKSVD